MSGTSSILAAPPPKKIARVQPTPHVVRPIPTKATTATPTSSSSYPAASSSNSSATNLAKPTPLPTSSPIAKPTPLLTTTQPQQQQQHQQQSFTPKSTVVAQPKQDPMQALSSLSKNPLSNKATTATAVSKPRTSLLTVVHSTLPGYKPMVTQSSVITKPAVPTTLSEVKRKNITSYSKPEYIDVEDDDDADDYPSSPEPNLNIRKEASINITTKVGF